jgi:hypothetical protein
MIYVILGFLSLDSCLLKKYQRNCLGRVFIMVPGKTLKKFEKKPDLLDRATRSISGSSERADFDAAYKELIKERKKDEERAKRRYGI